MILKTAAITTVITTLFLAGCGRGRYTYRFENCSNAEVVDGKFYFVCLDMYRDTEVWIGLTAAKSPAELVCKGRVVDGSITTCEVTAPAPR